MMKAVILDLDGTVYHGLRVIKGVPQAIAKLRKQGIKVFFLSNASMRTRREIANKLRRMGIPCKAREVYNTAYATADYIKKHYRSAKVYCITEGGLRKEMHALGIKTVNSDKANVVATGLDTKLTMGKLTTALRAINKGAVFIASNLDRVYPTEKGVTLGSGTIAASLEYATKKKPIVIGKPSPRLLETLLGDTGLKRNEILMVGDNVETDIAMAKNAKVKSALVLTGIGTVKEVKALAKKDRPDFVIKSLKELATLL
jgi:4-nitrophenyl phosphatase